MGTGCPVFSDAAPRRNASLGCKAALHHNAQSFDRQPENATALHLRPASSSPPLMVMKKTEEEEGKKCDLKEILAGLKDTVAAGDRRKSFVSTEGRFRGRIVLKQFVAASSVLKHILAKSPNPALVEGNVAPAQIRGLRVRRIRCIGTNMALGGAFTAGTIVPATWSGREGREEAV